LEAETSDLDHLFTHFSVSSLLFLLFFTFLFLRLLLPSVSSPPSASFFPSLLPQTEQQHPSRPLTKKEKSETTTQTRLATKNRNSRRAPELTRIKENLLILTENETISIVLPFNNILFRQKKSNFRKGTTTPLPSLHSFMTLDDDHVAEGANNGRTV